MIGLAPPRPAVDTVLESLPSPAGPGVPAGTSLGAPSAPGTAGWVAETERLGDEIARLAAHLHAGTYRLLVLIRAFDAREGWGGGFASCAHWLSWRIGLGLGAAREHVRVARSLGGLPAIGAAMARGALSYSKVRALTRVATAGNERELLDFALSGTASHVERLVRAWRRVDGAEAADAERERHERRYLELWPDEDGSWVLRGKLDPEVGAAVKAALDAAAKVLRAEAPQANAPAETVEQRRADAIGLLAERALAVVREDGAAPGEVPGRKSAHVPAGTPPTPACAKPMGRADRYQVVVHVDAEHAVLESSGRALVPETARRLACDCGVVVMTHDAEGGVLDVGRKKRTVPPAIRRALEHRDRGCRFPGCGLRYVDAHHIEHWMDGGATKLANLALLCRQHHRLVHEGGWRLEIDDARAARFYRPDGRALPEVPALPPAPADVVDAMVADDARRGLAIDADTTTPEWHGERLDLDWAISVMWRPRADAARAEEAEDVAGAAA